MGNFHGHNKKKKFFEGWYFKHQKGDNTIAFIPGINIINNKERYAFIQVITNDSSYNITYPFESFWVSDEGLKVKIGENIFSEEGIEVHIQNEEIHIHGKIKYEELTPIKYDIMGPFAAIPFMECNHGVISVHHRINGEIFINNEKLDFNEGVGYIEKDWGSSFPKTYLWTQCNDFKGEKCSIMVSIADIPFAICEFKGCIAVVYYKGVEYRMATYNGVKIIDYNSEGLEIRKGKYTLKINITSKNPQELLAPSRGTMDRLIHENASCSAEFEFYENNELLFHKYSDNSSFEYVEN